MTALDAVLQRMTDELAELDGDVRRYFHATYLRTTVAVADELAAGGFADPDWVARWDVVFADLYLDALDADRAGSAVPGPWRVALGASPDLPPLRHVLLGLNAHINYDLPQALVGVISSAEFDDADLIARRSADHRHLDTVLQARVGAEDDELSAVSRVTVADRLLRPANRAASRRFLAEARAKVWRNAVVLDRARRDGRYELGLAQLEALCAQRVRDLLASRQVLLTLARRGFGVVLPGG